jgi:hypothetical protein
MNTEIPNRLANVITELEKIRQANILTENKKKIDNKTDKKRQNKNVIENLDTRIVNTSSEILDYTKNTHIITAGSPIYLPKTPIPLEVLKIINLGASHLKVITNESENIFHSFYSPKGSPHIFIPSNSCIEVFFITNSSGENLWIAK